MLNFNGAWRFESPGGIPNGVIPDFSDLIGKITTQGDVPRTLEHFKVVLRGRRRHDLGMEFGRQLGTDGSPPVHERSRRECPALHRGLL
jgi:hypothetical protein